MAERGVDIEMGEYGEDEEEEMEEEEETGETGFTDGDHRTVTVGRTYGRDGITHVTEERPDSGSRTHERHVTERRKELLRNTIGVTLNKTDGKESKYLLENIQSVYGKKGGLIGLKFKDERIMVRKKGEFVYSEAEKNAKAVERFRELLSKAEAEHEGTLAGAVEEANSDSTTSEEVVGDIISQASSAISNRVEERDKDLQEQAEGIVIPEQEIGELSGILNPQGTDTENIRSLEILAEDYRVRAWNEIDLLRKQYLSDFSDTAELKADNIRFKIGERPEHTEAVSILSNEVENNDLNRMERFKKWARKNIVGLSAIAITIAGIVTTIVVAARKAVSGGAKAVGGFAKALANLAKKLGPLLAPLFNLVAQVLTWVAKGMAWLANNLWVLAIAMAWLLYDYWKNRE